MKFILRFLTLALLGSNVPNLYAQPYYMWATEIGGTQTDVGNCISSDGASNVIVCGRFQGTIDANPAAGTQNPMTSAGDFDMMVVKFNAQGAFQWAKNAGGLGFDEFTMVKTDTDDNVYLFGSFEQTIDLDPNDAMVNYTSAGGRDLVLIKLNANGETQWVRAFGGSDAEAEQGIAIDAQGNLILTGSFNGSCNFDPNASNFSLTSAGENDIFVMKLDSQGNFMWAKQIGSSSFDFSYGVVCDGNQNLILAGRFRNTVDFDPGTGVANGTSNGLNDGFVLKLNNDGDYLWHQCFGGSDFDEIWALSCDPSGNVVTTGYFSGTVDLDPGSTSQNFTSNGSDDLFIQKFDPDGNLLWVRVFGGSQLENSYDVLCDLNGDIVVTGDYFSTVDFDPGAGTFNQTSLGNNDIFYLKLDTDGNFVWAQSIGATFSQAGYALGLTPQNDILATGTFSNTVDFHFGSGVNFLSDPSNFDAFVLKIKGNCAPSLLPSTIEVVDDSLVITDFLSNNNFSVQWIDCGTSEPITGANTPSFQIPGGGSFGAVVSIETCSVNTDCVSITSNPAMDENAHIMPNPFSNRIHLQNVHEGDRISLWNLEGKCVAEHVAQGPYFTMDGLETLPHAMYILRIQNKDFTINRKMLK